MGFPGKNLALLACIMYCDPPLVLSGVNHRQIRNVFPPSFRHLIGLLFFVKKSRYAVPRHMHGTRGLSSRPKMRALGAHKC